MVTVCIDGYMRERKNWVSWWLHKEIRLNWPCLHNVGHSKCLGDVLAYQLYGRTYWVIIPRPLHGQNHLGQGEICLFWYGEFSTVVWIKRPSQGSQIRKYRRHRVLHYPYQVMAGVGSIWAKWLVWWVCRKICETCRKNPYLWLSYRAE